MVTPAAPTDPVPHVEVPRGHPQGLWVLFITEMWERFSYYGMRALLVLYLIQGTGPLLSDGSANSNPGFGWSAASASLLYAVYTWAVYLTPLAGGWLADRFLGTHRSMLIGGWIIAAGHVTLAMTELFGITPGQAVTLQTGPMALICFLSGLLLIVIGTGFFKPCVSVMVGQLYDRDDPRKDSGFTIFYMGINLGAAMSPLVAGTLGEKLGWHWGFGSAAVGMVLGLIFYQIFRPKYLRGIGLPTGHSEVREGFGVAPEPGRRPPLTAVDWQRIGVILVLAFVGNIFFWAAFEQAGSSMNIFAKEKTDRTFGGWWGADQAAENGEGASTGGDAGFPASWYQSVNAIGILIFAPAFAWLWSWLNRRNANPSTPMKFAWGLYLLGLAFLAMVFGALEARGAKLAGPHWLLITYIVVTWGELCLSPVGLSMVTRLAPPHLQSLMMGIWFGSMSLANLFAGLLAAFSTHMDTTRHIVELKKGQAYADVRYDPLSRELRALIVGGDAATPLPIGQSTVEFQGFFKRADGREEEATVLLRADPQKGEGNGLSSQFAGSLDSLPEDVDDIEDIRGTFVVTVGGDELTTSLEHRHYTFIFPGLPGFYLLLVVFPIGAGVVLTVLTPVLKRMMHGVH
jgi:POT family proton-dependent oligopeptide transporter